MSSNYQKCPVPLKDFSTFVNDAKRHGHRHVVIEKSLHQLQESSVRLSETVLWSKRQTINYFLHVVKCHLNLVCLQHLRYTNTASSINISFNTKPQDIAQPEPSTQSIHFI